MLAKSFILQGLLLLFCVSFSSARDDPVTLKWIDKKNFAYTGAYQLPSLQDNVRPSMPLKEARRVRKGLDSKEKDRKGVEQQLAEKLNEEQMKGPGVISALSTGDGEIPSRRQTRPKAPKFIKLKTRSDFHLSNAQQAQKLNAKFATLTAHSPCTNGENACVASNLAHCVGGQFIITPCAHGSICAALPLVNSPGTSVTCTHR